MAYNIFAVSKWRRPMPAARREKTTMSRPGLSSSTENLSSHASGLPAHWRRGRLLAALLVFCVAAAVTYGMSAFGQADALDAWWLRARFSAREALQGRPRPDPDIVIVGIDDRSLDKWPEPVIAWGGHLADAVNRMRAGGARVIALDWIQPEPTGKWFNQKFRDNDLRLGEALSKTRNVVMVKEFRPGAPADKEWITTTPEILYALPEAALDPERCMGYAELTGKDSVVAAMEPAQPAKAGSKSSASETSFAARIVERVLGADGQLQEGRAWTIPGKVRAPLRADNSLLVNYRSFSGQGAFTQYSLSDIAQPSKQPDTRFKDKIVLVGYTAATGFNDSHYVPFLDGWSKARLIPGVEMHANLARTLLDSRPLREPSRLELWLLAMTLGSVGLLAFSRLRWAMAALVALAAALAWIAMSFALFIARDIVLPINLPLLGLLLTSALMGGYRALGEERERAQVMQIWERFQDPRLVDFLLQNPQFRGGQGREVQATVLFADLKNFTKTVESLSPEDALQMLNRYLALMSEVILKHGGLVDKYLGDGLMAQWGAPAPWDDTAREHHAAPAVRACLELEQRTRELTDSITGPNTRNTGASANGTANGAADGQRNVTFGLRLTLHTGPVVAGCVGPDNRLEYTIIGDTVNVTSRLQETAKELGCEFLISESTYEHVRDDVITGREAQVESRGRQQPLRVYEIVGAANEADAAPNRNLNGAGIAAQASEARAFETEIAVAESLL